MKTSLVALLALALACPGVSAATLPVVQDEGIIARPPSPRPNPQPPQPHPRPNPKPPEPHPRPNPKPPEPHPRPNPEPWPYPHPRPIPVPIPVPWPYPAPYPPCSFGQCAPNEVFLSPDGTRAVWIQGAARDAYLYDRTGLGGWEPRWLDWDVDTVRWDMAGGMLMAIEVVRDDGRVELFDPYGDWIGGMTVESGAPVVLPPHRDLSKPLSASPSLKRLSDPVRWD